MIDVSSAVKVDHGLESDLGGWVASRGGGGELLGEVVVAVDVGGVVFAVVELHDLAGDGGFEGAVVVWVNGWLVSGVNRDANERERSIIRLGGFVGGKAYMVGPGA